MVIATAMVMDDCHAMTATQKTQELSALASEMKAEKIGYRMKLLREALDMRPSEISDSLGIERTYWSRQENGKRYLTDSLAAQLVERYGVTLDFLILGKWDGLPLRLAEKMREIDRKYS